MADPLAVLTARLQPAFDALEPGADPVVRPSDRADAQCNGALPLAKRLGRNPREVAAEVVAAARLDDICSVVEVAGPGFVNLTFRREYLADQLADVGSDGRLGLPIVSRPDVVVVDYSAPNVAKEMHVGHLRTTIIGDALVRVLGALGHTVIRENHVGDWGTPFGMLIEHLLDLGEDEAAHELSVGDLDTFYRQARTKFDADDEFKERSRQRVVELQSGDPETLRLWRDLVDQSVAYFDQVYAKLDVLLTDGDLMGESAYNDRLPQVVADLDAAGLLVESEGARCVFPPGFEGREGEPQPLIVQKADGGFGYSATDLACIRDRVERLGATRALYVVGAPQAQHFAMVFAVAVMAGWLPEHHRFEHVPFGNVLGPDRKMFKTRSGGTVKLGALLDEAVDRAAAAVADKNPDLTSEERAAVAQMVGRGAVKYADLSTDRIRDYVFDWDRMLAFDGDTGPYLQYAHARIRSIFRRAEVAPPVGVAPILGEPAEVALAKVLLRFPTAVEEVAETASPHKLCGYLHDLASTFTTSTRRARCCGPTSPCGRAGSCSAT